MFIACENCERLLSGWNRILVRNLDSFFFNEKFNLNEFLAE